MLNHLRPQYAKGFRCIGAECEDTCCHGWRVVVDKGTYEKYRSNSDLRSLTDNHLVLITSSPTNSAHALIKLTPSFNCPFLAADRLCSIQKEHGEEYLAEGCSTYPRVARRIDGLMEKALYLSCPEAARLVLLNPSLMQADESATGGRSPYYRFFLMGSPAKNYGSPLRYRWEIRSLSLLLLQDRAYPLWQRLFILGMFCKRLKKIISQRQIGLVPGLLKDYAEIITQGQLRSAMDGISAQTEPQLRAVLEIIQRYNDPKFRNTGQIRLWECVQDFLRGIRYDPSSPIESYTQFYAEAHSRYYRPFMLEHPYIMENYLINYVFRTDFPFLASRQGEGHDVQREYLNMCIQYAAIRGLLIGMAGHYRAAFGAGHVVKLVQSFSKAVEHCPAFLETSNPRMASAEGMALLLKT
jgi:lysine-N-methylase